MDDNRIDKAAAFDTLFTSNRIQILKILAYYMDPRLLKGLAVYIKMSELQYTLQFVAVKSLIFSASTFYLCSIVCGGACQCFRKRLAIIFGYSTIKSYSYADMCCDGLHSFDKVIKDK